MSKKFKKIVNAPHRAAARLTANIAKSTPKSNAWRVVRVAGTELADFSTFLLWVANVVALDNTWLRKMESVLANMDVRPKIKIDKETKKPKTVKPGVVKRLAKEYPDLTAHILYYLMFAMAFGGVKVANKIRQGENDAKPQDIEVVIPAQQVDKVDMNAMLDPQSPDFIDQCVALENITCIGLIYTETYRATPKVQPSENVWTHGFGLTWSLDKNGKFVRDYADTKSNRRKKLKLHKPAQVRTADQDLDETQVFLRQRIYPQIQKYMKRPMTVAEFIAVCIAGYQLEGHIDTICEKLSVAKNQRQIADAFMAPDMKRYEGTHKRRWVSAALATGRISMKDILDADIDNFYKGALSRFTKDKKRFILDDQTVEYVMNIPRDTRTLDVVSGLADGRVALAQLGIDPSEIVIKYTASYADAIALFRDEQYDLAAQKFQDLISENPKDIGLYNDLAATYNNLGRYDDAIDVSNQALNIGGKKLAVAAAYYNAAVAYEKKGDLQRALANYKLAVRNGNRRVQRDVTRVTEKMQSGGAVARVGEFRRAGYGVSKMALDARNRDVAQMLSAKRTMA